MSSDFVAYNLIKITKYFKLFIRNSKKMTSLKPMRRVRKDHTCRSLGLLGLDLCHMCDKCKYFQMRVDGLSGRRPGKSQMEKCENHGIFLMK